MFSHDLERIARIPTKEYADAVLRNVTDDRTHEAGYYQPEYDVKIDHGTVGVLELIACKHQADNIRRATSQHTQWMGPRRASLPQ